MLRISIDDFKNAENTAFAENLHIRRAIAPYLSDKGEIGVLDARKVIRLVKPRAENAHKGSFGRLVFVGGSDRYPGAVQLASLAALRSGVGLMSVVTTRRAALALSCAAREATVLPVEADVRGFMSPSAEEMAEIGELISRADAVLLGPGLGTGDGCREILEFVLESADCPIILDADGINLVLGRIELLRRARAGLILTPHPAELARLAGVAPDVAVRERFDIAKKLADDLGCVVAAKSSGTIIVGGGRAYLSVRGNNGLARGGSGDLLAGLIGSFAAQGYSPLTAAAIGVTVQGLGCELASEKLGRRGMLPSDVINALPMLFKKFEG